MEVEVVNRTGYVQWQLTEDTATHELVQPTCFINIDVTNWTRKHGSAITLPPKPLAAA